MDIIISTRNPSKLEQIRGFFDGLPISFLTLDDVGIEGDAIEDGETLEENALKKALFAFDCALEKTWVIADDTGLFINALDGAPGIKAARWAGETATTDEITEHALRTLQGVVDRSATFETVVVVMAPDGQWHSFSGDVRGHLLEAPRVKPQPKMPYSPIFVPDGFDLVWAEMSVELENSISHRGKALRKARIFLEGYMK